MRKIDRYVARILSIVAAACGMLVFNACDPFFSDPIDSKDSGNAGRIENASEKLIDSLDKWNYYAARKTIADHCGVTQLSVKNPKTGGIVTVADSEGSGYDQEFPAGSWSEEIKSENENINKPQDTETKVYYALNEWNSFTVEKTVYFQMRLEEETGFLASRVGVGTVEVVVSLGDYLDDLSMITFRNGDRFYSCLYHGYGGYDENASMEKFYFAAYRYVEGFYYVKDLEWEHYEFCVAIGDGDVAFSCDYTHTGEENETPVVIEGSTYIVYEQVTYTIAELEEYFRLSEDVDGETDSLDGVV